MLDDTLAQLMQRILQQASESTPANGRSMRLLKDLGFGRIKGKTLYFSERDRQEMAALLLARGFAIEPVDLKDLSRSERLTVTPFEKAGGAAVKVGRISVKALPGRTLNVGGRSLSMPDGCHLDADWRLIANAPKHDAIMVVENYEAFDQIHRVALDIDGIMNPLVLYRGDRHESRQDNVSAILEVTDLPVIAFVDLDPKGLHIAARLPRLIGVVAPSLESLSASLQSPAIARTDLYRNQLAGVEASLNQLEEDSPVCQLWALLRKYRAGIVQERWIGRGDNKLGAWN